MSILDHPRHYSTEGWAVRDGVLKTVTIDAFGIHASWVRADDDTWPMVDGFGPDGPHFGALMAECEIEGKERTYEVNVEWLRRPQESDGTTVWYEEGQDDEYDLLSAKTKTDDRVTKILRWYMAGVPGDNEVVSNSIGADEPGGGNDPEPEEPLPAHPCKDHAHQLRYLLGRLEKEALDPLLTDRRIRRRISRRFHKEMARYTSIRESIDEELTRMES